MNIPEFQKLFKDSAPLYNTPYSTVEEGIYDASHYFKKPFTNIWMSTNSFIILRRALGSRVALDALTIKMAVDTPEGSFVVEINHTKEITDTMAYLVGNGLIGRVKLSG